MGLFGLLSSTLTCYFHPQASPAPKPAIAQNIYSNSNVNSNPAPNPQRREYYLNQEASRYIHENIETLSLSKKTTKVIIKLLFEPDHAQDVVYNNLIKLHQLRIRLRNYSSAQNEYNTFKTDCSDLESRLQQAKAHATKRKIFNCIGIMLSISVIAAGVLSVCLSPPFALLIGLGAAFTYMLGNSLFLHIAIKFAKKDRAYTAFLNDHLPKRCSLNCLWLLAPFGTIIATITAFKRVSQLYRAHEIAQELLLHRTTPDEEITPEMAIEITEGFDAALSFYTKDYNKILAALESAKQLSDQVKFDQLRPVIGELLAIQECLKKIKLPYNLNFSKSSSCTQKDPIALIAIFLKYAKTR